MRHYLYFVLLVSGLSFPSLVSPHARLGIEDKCLPRGKEVVNIARESDGTFACARMLKGRLVSRSYFLP